MMANFVQTRLLAPTPLGHLARAVSAVEVTGDPATRIAGVRQDSRRVEAGDLFVVRAGERTTGLRYVADALARGAVALMAESNLSPIPLKVPVVIVSDVRRALARAAALVCGDPFEALDVVGITGTNGKTTIAHLVEKALLGAGHRPGVMGTVGYRFEDLALEATHTTPEADELARVAAAMVARGASHLVMEVSSHAIAQARVDAVRFRVAAFTNLTQDHLDYHGDMESYGETKARLFLEMSPAASVVNVEDPFGAKLAARIAGPLVTVSHRVGSDADIAPLGVSLGPKRTAATVRTRAGEVLLDSSLIGVHNLSNILVCLGICSALGVDLHVAAASLREVSVPGRLERCDGLGDDVVVVVDYAHTPDALDRALSALTLLRERDDAAGRLICVFGCGGDRDPAKREPMGRAVAKWADIAVVTTDNPRGEDPAEIANAILPGLEGARATIVELDRARAIAFAISGARPGDLVLIAGKGHETYQISRGITRHFDDREEARAALALRRKREQGA